MARFRTTIAMIVTLVLALTGCGPSSVKVPEVIAVTIKPVAMIAQAIVGSVLTIETLGGDMGVARENAADLASRSAVIFETGTAVDAWSNDFGTGTVRLVKLSAALTSSTADGAWLSFGDSADMARLIRDTLDALFPEFKGGFDSRYATLVDQCSQADGRLKQLVWKASTRVFVAADTTWSGAAHDFGLRVVVQSALKSLDLAGPVAAATITAWGSGEKTHIAVVNVVPGSSTGVNRLPNGLVICRLDPLGMSADGGFVSWLEGQLTLLGSALGM
jgi:ABC-type Zn uptake system ZnuABC Zn-binding protein ZnuA